MACTRPTPSRHTSCAAQLLSPRSRLSRSMTATAGIKQPPAHICVILSSCPSAQPGDRHFEPPQPYISQHTPHSCNTLWSRCFPAQLFSLAEQSEHKAAFLRQHCLLPGRPPVVVLAHSIGSHMAVAAVAQVEEELRVAAAGAALPLRVHRHGWSRSVHTGTESSSSFSNTCWCGSRLWVQAVCDPHPICARSGVGSDPRDTAYFL